MNKCLPILAVLLLALSSCDGLFEYHPNQIILDSDEKNLTAYNLQKIRQQQPGDTLKLIVMGDTQRFYDDAQDFVKKANGFQDIDFVVHQGDISDFGMTQEFKWIHDIMEDLKWPYFTVIGNHDMLANARKVYKKMYGDFNYSFVYGHTKFVFIDTNSREYSFNGKVPDLGWLRGQLQQEPGATWKQAITISHIPPYDGDFDKKLELPFHQTLKESNLVSLSLYGHIHRWLSEYPYDNHILYHATTTVKERGFSYIRIWEGGYDIKRIAF
ncbi:metallophosphoesterase [Rufibacter sp. XAAS-G3-1]|uniref:metallophosphoesterase family protein n=1 Tax=Rufibacter sp. XAAS-G3-1 TaxID=2729134 RepID=UPI0015E7A308|nr:metallophosphoesterase [Rufibacter sp. XAAS-G3-1]